VPQQFRVRLGPLLMNFTERTDKERKPIKMNTAVSGNEPTNDPEWNPPEARSHYREGAAGQTGPQPRHRRDDRA
jgi:hypothetical protein